MLRNLLRVYFMKVMNYFLNRNASGFQVVGDTLAGCLHKRVGRRGVLGKNQELFCKNFVKGSPLQGRPSKIRNHLQKLYQRELTLPK